MISLARDFVVTRVNWNLVISGSIACLSFRQTVFLYFSLLALSTASTFLRNLWNRWRRKKKETGKACSVRFGKRAKLFGVIRFLRVVQRTECKERENHESTRMERDFIGRNRKRRCRVKELFHFRSKGKGENSFFLSSLPSLPSTNGT